MSEDRTHVNRPPSVAGITRIALTANKTSSPVYVPGSCTVWAKPGVGGTMLVEASWSPPADIENDTAAWFAWDQGTAGVIDAAAAQVLPHGVAVRFTTYVADGICGVTV